MLHPYLRLVRSYATIAAIFTLLATSPAFAQATTAADPKGNSAMSDLTQFILRNDRRAITKAQQAGAGAAPEIQPFLSNKDPQIRELAILCLDSSNAPNASSLFAKALLDEDISVQIAAARSLNHHPDPAVVPALVAAYPRIDYSGIRGQVALAIGATGKGLNELRPLALLEKEEPAKEGCIVALAKLGDKPSQTEFVNRWVASKGPDRGKYFDYATYINDPWLLKPLLTFLDDKSPAYRIGVDARPDLPHYLLSCDAAVNLIAVITKNKFAFMATGGPNYTGSQIDEVRQYLRSHPPQ